MMDRVLVIGPGRVGKCLALVHQRAGAEVMLLGHQQGLWMDWARAHAMTPVQEFDSVPDENLLVLLTVPDDQLEDAVTRCREHLKGSHNVLLHLSGASDLEVFADFGEYEAQCAAIHPLMAFSGDPEADLNSLASSLATVATGSRFQEELAWVLKTWGVEALPLDAKLNRANYHLGLSLLSNHVTALCGWASELLSPALGDKTPQVIADMANRAVESCVEQGAANALTGPVVRGDVETVRAHLAALPGPEAVRYRGALVAVVDLALVSGRLSAEGAAEFRDIIAGDAAK